MSADEKQPELPGIPTHNPDRYRRLSEPFANGAAVDKAIEGFHRELGVLREKYKLPDVYVVVAANALTEDGDETAFMTTLHFGAEARVESLAAYAYGLESARRQERMGRLLANVLKLRRGVK